jgi:hypothetical protein
VRMRISAADNKNITHSNTVLASRVHWLQPGQNVTSQINFTMPALIRNRRYYFGYTVPNSGDIDAGDNRTILRTSYVAN